MRKPKMAILFTPRTPRWGKAVIVVIWLISWQNTNLNAQSKPVLDSLQVYQQAYKQYLVEKWQAERIEFVQSTRKKWWYFLPTFGYTLRYPTVSFNTGLLAQIDQNRTTVKARLKSLDYRYQVEYVEMLQRIANEYRKLQIRFLQLEQDKKTIDKLRQIHTIHTEAADREKMAPEEYLRNSYQFEQAVSNLNRQFSDWQLSVLDFYELCRYQLPQASLTKPKE